MPPQNTPLPRMIFLGKRIRTHSAVIVAAPYGGQTANPLADLKNRLNGERYPIMQIGQKRTVRRHGCSKERSIITTGRPL